jgi:hypothetical protein
MKFTKLSNLLSGDDDLEFFPSETNPIISHLILHCKCVRNGQDYPSLPINASILLFKSMRLNGLDM